MTSTSTTCISARRAWIERDVLPLSFRTAVISVGHRRSTPLPMETVAPYLSTISFAGTTIARLKAP